MTCKAKPMHSRRKLKMKTLWHAQLLWIRVLSIFVTVDLFNCNACIMIYCTTNTGRLKHCHHITVQPPSQSTHLLIDDINIILDPSHEACRHHLAVFLTLQKKNDTERLQYPHLRREKVSCQHYPHLRREKTGESILTPLTSHLTKSCPALSMQCSKHNCSTPSKNEHTLCLLYHQWLCGALEGILYTHSPNSSLAPFHNKGFNRQGFVICMCNHGIDGSKRKEISGKTRRPKTDKMSCTASCQNNTLEHKLKAKVTRSDLEDKVIIVKSVFDRCYSLNMLLRQKQRDTLLTRQKKKKEKTRNNLRMNTPYSSYIISGLCGALEGLMICKGNLNMGNPSGVFSLGDHLLLNATPPLGEHTLCLSYHQWLCGALEAHLNWTHIVWSTRSISQCEVIPCDSQKLVPNWPPVNTPCSSSTISGLCGALEESNKEGSSATLSVNIPCTSYIISGCVEH
ncbi:hypothetical protein EMCRGX_G008120 [Ephydatia muelleri]